MRVKKSFPVLLGAVILIIIGSFSLAEGRFRMRGTGGPPLEAPFAQIVAFLFIAGGVYGVYLGWTNSDGDGQRSGVFYGAGGAAAAGVARVPLLEIGSYGLSNGPVMVTDLSEWNRRESAVQKVEVGGLLGSVNLELLRARIDYETGVLTLRKPDKSADRTPAAEVTVD